MNRVALALCALLFAACDPQISALSIDAGPWDAGGVACAESPCVNGGVCNVTDEGFHCACPPGFEGDLCEVDVNDCDPNPCKNDGLCNDRVAGYACVCAPGFAGVDCSTNIDECTEEPCENGGECTDLVNGYQCDCAPGYSGSRCEVNIDDCASLPCENGGECQDEVNGFTCNCIEGNTGPTCSNQIERCSDGLCQNGGTCADTEEGYVCTCAAGYNGTNCENDVDDCASGPCVNGECTDKVNGYECACPTGYEGVNCEHEIDPCNPDPCQNAGECVRDGDAFYLCICKDGFSGTNCQNNVDECSANPCKNGGTCTQGVDGFTCECEAGFAGPTCSNEPDECPDVNPCGNGVCVNGAPGQGYKCDCDVGFIGATCEVNIDDCQPDPCAENQGTCTDAVNGYTCACETGYEGPECQGNIDDCIDEPCQNGGTCQDLVNAYECTCAPGWAGDTCTENIDECDPNPCQHGGTCNDEVNGYSCDCVGGYGGDSCEDDQCALVGSCGNGSCKPEGGCNCDAGWEGPDCRDDIDECVDDMPCLNGAMCVDLDGSFSCECALGYTGMLCDACASGYQDNDEDGTCCLTGYTGEDCLQCDDGFEDVNGVCERTCNSSPKDCGDHGACAIEEGETVCMCDSPWVGELCDSFIGMCSEGICGDHGSCEPTSSNTARCECEPGYVGQYCEILDECALAIANGMTPCANDGLCVDGDNTYTCTCTDGWTGADCSEVDECEVAVAQGMTPCSGHGTCVDGDGTFTCTCDAGWDLEPDCSEEDNCVDHECLNGGECVDGDNTYTCTCPDDYIGDHCETLEDDCAINPCLNGGSCSNVGTTFECDCARTGFTGATCEDDFDECTQNDICGSGTCTNRLGGEGYTCTCPDGSLDVGGDGTNCAQVASVYAGSQNSCAISVAGSLHCWGDNLYGQLGQGHAVNPGPTELRTPHRIGTGTNWSKVSIGGQHLCGLRAGRLFCWGRNENLQVGTPSSIGRDLPVEIRPDLTWDDVSVGDSHTCARSGTSIYCWGNSANSQAGTPTSGNNVDAPTLVDGTWIALSAGAFHTCAINTDNELHCWGLNSSGQLGGFPPIALPGSSDGPWSAVEAGPQHTCAVAGTRTFCWGEGSKGALGNGTPADNASPQLVDLSETLGSLETGQDFSCGATIGSEVYCWGTNDSALLLTGAGDVSIPTRVDTDALTTWDGYAVGDQHMCGLSNGLVQCWGSNADGAVGNAAPSPTLVTTPGLVKSAAVIHSGKSFCSPDPCKNGGECTATENGFSCDCTGTGFSGTTCTDTVDECDATPTICGDGTCRDLLDGDGYSCTCPDGLFDVDDGTVCERAGLLAVGTNHTCAVTETSRTMHCWGSNRHGGLGMGSLGTADYYPPENSQSYRTPLRLRTIPDVTTDARGWTHVTVGEGHTCGVIDNTDLYCWGNNVDGQVRGIDMTVPDNFPAPVLLDDSRTWVALSAGFAHTCALDATGNLYCWGNNEDGQLGLGTTSAYELYHDIASSPVPAPNGETWVGVVANGWHVCGRTNASSVYCWGYGSNRQIGNGSNVSVPTPTKVSRSDPQGFGELEAGTTTNCALVGGTAYCWGQGNTGAIGDGGGVNRDVPTQVSGSLSFSRLTAGSNFMCGLVDVPATTPQAYTAYCWGNNTKNLLLTGGPNALVPTAIMTTRQWDILDLGPLVICGVDHADGLTYCWGDNGVEEGVGQGRVGSVPFMQVGTIGLIGPVRNAPFVHEAQ